MRKALIWLLTLAQLCIASFVCAADEVHAGAATQRTITPDMARPTPTRESLEEYMAVVSERYGVPLGLMIAIAAVESKFNSWALNIKGRSYFPGSKEAALDLLKVNTERSFDVGVMQINSQWLRKLKLSVADTMEPHINILVAAYILNENIIAYGPTVKAVAAYHSPTQDRGRRYAKEVWRYYQSYLRQKG